MSLLASAFLKWAVAELGLSFLLFLVYFAVARRLQNAMDRYVFLCGTLFVLPFLPWVPLPALPWAAGVALLGERVAYLEGTSGSPSSQPFGFGAAVMLVYGVFLVARWWRLFASWRLLRHIGRGGERHAGLSPWPVVLHDVPLPPISVGVFRPEIFLPRSVFETVSAAELRMILDHEEAHLRRHDCLVNLVRVVVREVLCFSPFAWILAEKLEEEMELSIDAAVLNGDRSRTRSYGNLLVDLAGNSAGSAPIYGSLLFPKNALKRRLLAMKQSAYPRRQWLGYWLSLAFLFSALTAVTALRVNAAPGSEGLEFRLGTDATGTVVLSQADFQSAETPKDCQSHCPVSVRLNPAATDRFAGFTEKNIGKKLGIFVDGKLISAPVIKARIGGGRLEVSGNFSPADAQRLVSAIHPPKSQ